MTGRRCILLIVAAFAFTAGASPSGKLSIDATVDRHEVAPEGVVTLTVIVRAAGLALPSVSLPQLTGVTVNRDAEAQNFSMVNGRVERTSTTLYRLVPHRLGTTIQIPPLKVSAGGETAATSPITLTVTLTPAPSASASPTPRSTGRPTSGTPELFVKASVDRPRVFWNQQTVLRLKLYSRVDLVGDPDWRPPTMSGFWAEGLGPARKSRTTLKGVTYDVTEIPTAVFPTRTGTLTIGAGEVHCRVARVAEPPDPWSMLAVPEVLAQEVTLTTGPITVVVDPLPSGAPAGFQGAVGDFQLALKVDGLTARAGEPIQARATIRGTGNISTVRDPEVHAEGAARQYVAGTSTRIDRSGDLLVGERQVITAFVPDQPGGLNIHPVTFAWFDPEAKRYRVQKSESVKVKILPGGAHGEPGRVTSVGGAVAAPRRTKGPFGGLGLDPSSADVALLGLSALAYGAALVTAGARRRKLRDPRLVRFDSLKALVGRDLVRADTYASQGQTAKAAALAEHALAAGAGHRYDVDIAGLARAERIQALRSRGADDVETQGIEKLFDALGAIAYAPPETRRSDARQAIREVRSRLDRYREEVARAA